MNNPTARHDFYAQADADQDAENDSFAMDMESNEPEIASVTTDRYMGGDSSARGGFNVYLGGEQVLAGLPKNWADKAAALINAQPTLAAQSDEVRRISAAV